MPFPGRICGKSALQIYADEGLQKYNRARWCLVGAFAVFGFINLLIILRLYASEPVYQVFFHVMLVAYLLLMALYTRLFVKSYRAFCPGLPGNYQLTFTDVSILAISAKER